MNLSKADSGQMLPVMEHFYTIQGEGKNSGRAAYFVRLAGCDVGCVWCDVKDSWEANEHQIMSVETILSHVLDSKTDFCVITGGEPCMHDLNSLTTQLKTNNIEIALETSGCYQLKGVIDWYCFSPKKFKAPLEEAYTLANEMKIIISHPSDFEWAENHAKKLSPKCALFVQPEWSKQERFLPMIVDFVKKNPAWKVSLQTHKIMNIP